MDAKSQYITAHFKSINHGGPAGFYFQKLDIGTHENEGTRSPLLHHMSMIGKVISC